MSQHWLIRRMMAIGTLLVAGTMVLAACGGGEETPTTATGGATPTRAATAGATPTRAATAGATAAASPTMGGAMGGAWEPRDLTAQLSGSGATFPAPLYERWVAEYQDVAPNVTINYQAVGSGQGKRDFIGGITDFGGSDSFMTDEELQQAPDALHIPTVMGAVVITYNLPDVQQELQFSPESIAGIFLGEITTWNDPILAADNPGVELPDQPITVVHRSDGSGTTDIFTTYLSKVSQTWNDQVGHGTAVEWPTGIGGEGNPGVTAGVQQTPGAVGYVELLYALENGLPAPAVKNAAGSYVTPSVETVTNAAAGFLQELPDDLRISITNPPEGENSYPISGFTWMLVHQEYQDATKAQALTDFIYWCLTEGDATAEELHYAPLPDEVQQMAIQKLEQVTVNGEQVFQAP